MAILAGNPIEDFDMDKFLETLTEARRDMSAGVEEEAKIFATFAQFVAEEWIETDKLLEKMGYPSYRDDDLDRIQHMADRVRAVIKEAKRGNV